MAPVLQWAGGVTTPRSLDGLLRIAFVGAGKMAHLHLRALRRVRVPHTVVAVCDTQESVARELAALAGAASYTSLDDLLREANPQVVHVCTPAGTHFEPARAALTAGAHVYVEKPFVETEREARELLDAARERHLLVCAGHQQVRDAAYVALMHRLPEIGVVVQVESRFAFHPFGMHPTRTGPRALVTQLLDILPHPLSTLMAALERVTADPSAIEIAAIVAEPTELHAVLRANDVCGYLNVTLRARPVASTLSVAGRRGALTADFIRTSVSGAANPGTAPLEKAANPLIEAWQMSRGAVAGVARRLLTRGDYPGVAELIGDFYAAVARGGPSPLPPDHLRRLTAVYEELAANIRGAAARAAIQHPVHQAPSPTAPVAVLTGARGFFGKEIARALALRGFRVRGISRSEHTDDSHVHEWRTLDLSRVVPSEALAGAAVVVHAAAEPMGGYSGHQRNTIDATRNLLQAMRSADRCRLVYVSSLSVLQPPRTPWERQDERTPLARPDAREFGAYAWGKTEAERLVAAEALGGGIETRVLRPAALVDLSNPEIPGLLGRRLFGRWHLGLGRPRLPLAVCEVSQAAAAVAWCAEHFDEAPPVVNLIDDAIPTRERLLDIFRAHGWRGCMVWIPIAFFALLVGATRLALSLATLRLPAPLAVWAIFRPRRFNASLGARLLADAASARPSAPLVAGETSH
jgi:predicted dehydrogenase/nucleoside-diphosphate-sugar epimerase